MSLVLLSFFVTFLITICVSNSIDDINIARIINWYSTFLRTESNQKPSEKSDCDDKNILPLSGLLKEGTLFS
jgi:hypothetical protein